MSWGYGSGRRWLCPPASSSPRIPASFPPPKMESLRRSFLIVHCLWNECSGILKKFWIITPLSVCPSIHLPAYPTAYFKSTISLAKVKMFGIVEISVCLWKGFKGILYKLIVFPRSTPSGISSWMFPSSHLIYCSRERLPCGLRWHQLDVCENAEVLSRAEKVCFLVLLVSQMSLLWKNLTCLPLISALKLTKVALLARCLP